MTPPVLDQSAIWRVRRLLSRVILTTSALLFAGGLAMTMTGAPAGVTVLGSACLVLVTSPVLNVLAVLGEEIRRRDRVFAGVAVIVILLLAYTVIARVVLRP